MSEAASQQNTWHVLWDAYLVGICAVAVVSVFLLDGLVPGRAPVASACVLVALAAWLTVAGRAAPPMGPPGARTLGYVLVAVVVWAAAVWLAPAAVLAVPAMYPVLFSRLPLPAGVAGSVVVTLIPLTLDLVAYGLDSPHLLVAVTMTLMGLVAGPLIGIMVMTTVRQRIRMADMVVELERSRAETSRLSREAGISAERERLAREIHDTLAQGFTSIVTLAQAVQAELTGDPSAAARHVELIRDTARANLSEARTMVSSLTPPALGSGTLSAAIRRQCEAFTAETGIPVAVHIAAGLPESAMASNVVLLRATQESLANVRKHAAATRVSVELTAHAEGLRLSLEDNGMGLSSGQDDGYGLAGMRARAAHVGGTLQLVSTPGGGVTVRVEVPL